MIVMVLGASGIIGQSLEKCQPSGLKAIYHEGKSDFDLNASAERVCDYLDRYTPDVLINLAGESRPDVVEANPEAYLQINTRLPETLTGWSVTRGAHQIHVSTQAVFDGLNAPYGLNEQRNPINHYGLQKKYAENLVLQYPRSVSVIRPTFVLGVRPNPSRGRDNPVELMLGGQHQQVNDRWFSPSFAPDVAALIWETALSRPSGCVVHAGVPVKVTRYEIAKALGCDAQPVSHEDFPGIAPRPANTTYAQGSLFKMTLAEGLADCLQKWHAQQTVTA